MSERVILYSKPGCPYCEAAREYLGQRRLPFEERDVTRDAAALEDVRRIRAPGVPVILIDHDAIVGFDKPRVDDLLKAKLGVTGEPAPSTASKQQAAAAAGGYSIL